MMDNKEYGIAVLAGLFAFFGWFLLLMYVSVPLFFDQIFIAITYFNRFNVYWVWTVSFVIFILSVYILIYLWKWAGLEEEARQTACPECGKILWRHDLEECPKCNTIIEWSND